MSRMQIGTAMYPLKFLRPKGAMDYQPLKNSTLVRGEANKRSQSGYVMSVFYTVSNLGDMLKV